ncbi:hypothetical protein [Maribacter sp. 4G9]|uniref:hypothetical protein n=1 Tax=Maribacter sp. 4G9 TaxID=1889777 RepID=UPI000C149D29|nr:hypothetical protein [Maribacter sp. 4G9]PIB26717.1 hypothetical protein BFP75_00470 [Maribacter sp. 4G9]
MILLRKNKFKVVLGTGLLALLCILWEYYNGGVITHHLLARKDLPGISNWWGLLTLPTLAWISLTVILERQNKNQGTENMVIRRFLAAFIFGALASLLWEFKLDEILQYYILLPLPIALFKPVHLPEYLLGFVIGMLFTFGGILPIIVGLVLMLICFLIYKFVRILKSLF